MNKLILPDVDSDEFTGLITALIRNGFVVHCFRIAVQRSILKGKTVTKWERWIYYCPVELLPDFPRLVGEYEDKHEAQGRHL